MNTNPRGTLVQQGNFRRIDNALVEESSCMNDFNGFLVVSYTVRGANQTPTTQRIRLNVNRNTAILNAFGQRTSLCRIRRGARINAILSSQMTRSIPPAVECLFYPCTETVAKSGARSHNRAGCLCGLRQQFPLYGKSQQHQHPDPISHHLPLPS